MWHEWQFFGVMMFNALGFSIDFSTWSLPAYIFWGRFWGVDFLTSMSQWWFFQGDDGMMRIASKRSRRGNNLENASTSWTSLRWWNLWSLYTTMVEPSNISLDRDSETRWNNLILNYQNGWGHAFNTYQNISKHVSVLQLCSSREKRM